MNRPNWTDPSPPVATGCHVRGRRPYSFASLPFSRFAKYSCVSSILLIFCKLQARLHKISVLSAKSANRMGFRFVCICSRLYDILVVDPFPVLQKRQRADDPSARCLPLLTDPLQAVSEGALCFFISFPGRWPRPDPHISPPSGSRDGDAAPRRFPRGFRPGCQSHRRP